MSSTAAADTLARGPLIQTYLARWLDARERSGRGNGLPLQYIRHVLAKSPDVHLLDVESPVGEIQFLLARIVLLVTLARLRDEPSLYSVDIYSFFNLVADILEDRDFGSSVYNSGVHGAFTAVGPPPKRQPYSSRPRLPAADERAFEAAPWQS